MNFKEHYDLEGRHAFLSASGYHWTNYSDDKLDLAFSKFLAKQKGTELHDWASWTIRLGIKQAKTKSTLNMYINDAIGYRLSVEQPLYYSENCFGTADAIGFRIIKGQRGLLRIHDLKTGVTPANMRQLEIYDALFCLEYGFDPREIDHELRLYQSDDILIHNPDPNDILKIIDKIVAFDKRIELLKNGE